LRIVVLGAGAIGSLFGGLLSEAGLEVTLIGRPPHIEAIREHGLRIDAVKGKKIIRISAETDVSAVKGEVDIVLCTVKAYDTKQAAADAKALMNGESLFVCMQNGLDVEKEAADTLGEANVVRGVTNNGALIIKPGYVKHTGVGDTLIGLPNKRLMVKMEKLTQALNRAGLPTKITDDISRVVWSKVLINLGINAIGAITRLRNGDLLLSHDLMDLMRSAIEEGLTVAEGLKISFRDEDIISKTYQIARATAQNKNSMLQDVEKGRRTEIDFINGAIVRLGKRIGVPTPINDALTALIKGIELSTSNASREEKS
jgi:2-dehydropantoate 2-reductase